MKQDSGGAAVSAASNKPEARPKRRKVLGIIILAIVLGGAAFGTFRWWTVGRFLESTDDAFIQADITAIAAQVSGRIAEVRVADHQHVRAGDILVVIDRREFEIAHTQAEADLDAALAAGAELQAARQLQDSRIAESQARLETARTESQHADKEAERAKNLFQSHAISEEAFDEKDSTARQQRTKLVEAKASLAASRHQIAVIDAQVQEQLAAVAKARSALARIELQLEYCEIRAPFDGIVGNRHARVGGFLNIGSRILSLVPENGLYVEANFKESQLADMRPGQTVRIETDAFPDSPIPGSVESFSPATGAEFALLPAENATGNFTKIVQRVPVRIRFENTVEGLRPGLSATAIVDRRSSQ